ncbi:hypothetical protein H8E88_03910 [candidate division KSB1 bacterium]|nr:hypothetical protein [candidate division KSB1 bacterium]MBL7093555.1 hypothetical protein [candidate division KSB1 bacterium]
MSTINKEMWQSTLAQYQVWNEAKFQESIRNAGKVPLLQKWRRYLSMMEFGLILKPKPSDHEQKQKMEMLNKYYEQMKLFEARRKLRGESV